MSLGVLAVHLVLPEDQRAPAQGDDHQQRPGQQQIGGGPFPEQHIDQRQHGYAHQQLGKHLFLQKFGLQEAELGTIDGVVFGALFGVFVRHACSLARKVLAL